MRLDPILYGYLEAKFSKMTRQHYVKMAGKIKPKRIDFRRGTTSPVLIEFAVRPRSGGGQLFGSQNLKELRKLTRVQVAALRALLLLDLSPHPLKRNALKDTYDGLNAGPGRFVRKPVRVIYVQRDVQYDFLWKPHA